MLMSGFFFKQKTAYEMRISDWKSDVCSSDLMALMCGPELIIADEPTTALDVTTQAQILHLLLELKREMGLALVLITHDLGVVARVADRVAVMYAGEIVETGTAQDIFGTPQHPYTKRLLTCIPVHDRTRPGEHLGSTPALVPSLI